MANHYFLGVLLLALLFICSAENPESTADNGYPPLWDLVPESLEHFTMENKVVMDPWRYFDRMAMYRILLASTTKYFSILGSNNSGNILWGLALQHGWQFHTGRLADPSKTTICGFKDREDPLCISEKSWWACNMNYYLSVIPFLSAAAVGMFADLPPHPLEIVPPGQNTEDFCYSIDHCQSSFPDVMDKWKQYFQQMVCFLQNWMKFYITCGTAHVVSIAVANPKCQKRLSYLSDPEQYFGKSWATNVEYIAATHFLTDFQNTNNFQHFLPPRMLIRGDLPPNVPDFSPEENRALFIINNIYTINSKTRGVMLKQWKKAMCSEKGRLEGRRLMQNLFTNLPLAGWNILKIFVQFISNQKCPVKD
ncbi:LOW QUALITY PROTEIN: protein LEG1 homolog [Rhinatrema bivittatum]|uniref:LOW QUALITY PROTEIN: protein LEG1 homolog n=1 Tax=Rhinatrema bivittatum TaxID=194408 RepID=UPI001128325D|nr:LOW QUALITY PROTEIN: protein LEG1 homolog [Rhinatrema bivittatum]